MRIVEDEAVSAEIDDVFAEAFDFDALIDPANWKSPGEYYQAMPATTRSVVNKVVKSDEELRKQLREEVFPKLMREGRIQSWQTAVPRYIEQLQQKHLYTGKVVSADATTSRYETLSLVGAQIAVSRVNYQGETNQFVTNLMYWGRALPRNLTAHDVYQAVSSRGKELAEKLSNVFLYSLSLYKEREVLIDSGPEVFKIIQGPVFPYEMLVGSGKHHTMQSCVELLKKLIDDGKYATIISKSTNRELLALGMALDAGEYIVTSTGTQVLAEFLNTAHYVDTPQDKYRDEQGNKLSQKDIFEDFQVNYGPKVVQGVLRAHAMSAPYVFYCNQDNLDEAVHMLLADAAHTGARGFPLLIDLADQYCSGAFRASEYTNHMNAEFARAAGGSMMYQAERQTRD